MSSVSYYVGQRLSLKAQLCTVQYVGVVADKAGEWIGVEWDDPQRGKHDGTHNGVKYFTCRNPSPTAASFLRPSQPWDDSRTFLQALRDKYMTEDSASGAEIVYFSTKQAEEVGFAKFARRQAHLHGIHVLVLDHMRIRGHMSPDESDAISGLCAEITELDLSSNLFESLEEILELAALLPKLSHLSLDGNRFMLNGRTGGSLKTLLSIRTLSLSDVRLSWDDISAIAQCFPNMLTLQAARNDLTKVSSAALPSALMSIVLSDNAFSNLYELSSLSLCSALKTLTLKRCRISSARSPDGTSPARYSETLQALDLSYNAISQWTFFERLQELYPKLESLVVTGNPLYQRLISAEGRSMSPEDGYMLTIARLPQLQLLNHSKITEKERLNAETYYLNQIVAELANVPTCKHAELLAKHPRWQALCDDHGEPTIREKKYKETNQTGLAAQLIHITFILADDVTPRATTRSWQEDFPRRWDVYSLLGMVGKRLEIMPLQLRLIWETGEQDPLSADTGYHQPRWWDSSDEEDDVGLSVQDLVAREIELAAGTRAVGTYIESLEARVRVELNIND